MARRFWPWRRTADPAKVQEFRLGGLPHVHRVEAGSPLADARERGAVVLFEADDVGRYVCGRAAMGEKPWAFICGWTSYSNGLFSDEHGNLSEKRTAVAWGWPIDPGKIGDHDVNDVAEGDLSGDAVQAGSLV